MEGELLYLKNPKICPDGMKVKKEPGENILVYYITPSTKKFVGYACFYMFPEHCTISGIGIKDEAFKRKGIGTKMLTLIEKESSKSVEEVRIPKANDIGTKHLLSNSYTEINGRFFKKLR